MNFIHWNRLMTDTFRALCQELIDEIDVKAYGVKSLPSSVAIDRARAALAQPEPVVLTRPDCFNFAMDFLGGTEEVEVRNYIERLESAASAALAQPEPQGVTDEELVKHYDRAVTSAIAIRVAVRALTNEDRDAATVAGLRAVLARYGRHAIEPVPRS